MVKPFTEEDEFPALDTIVVLDLALAESEELPPMVPENLDSID